MADISQYHLLMQRPRQDEEVEPYLEDVASIASAKSNATAISEINPFTLVDKTGIVRELNDAISQDEVTESKKSVRELFSLKRLRPDFFLQHLDWNSFKVVSRTWINAWVMCILLIVPRSVRWMGTAAYVGVIVTVLVSVGGESVTLSCVSSFLTIFSVTVGFLGNTIIMAINARIRGKISAEQVMAAMVGSGECVQGDRECVALALLDGRYNTPGTNCIMALGYVTSLAVLIYLSTFPLMAAYITVPNIVGFIATIIMIAYSNHVPYFDPWGVGVNMYKPVLIACACRMILAVLWFPTTSCANVMGKVAGMIGKISKTATRLFDDTTAISVASEQFGDLASKFHTSFHPPVSFWGSMRVDIPLIRYEFAYSRLDSCDASEFMELMRRLAYVYSTFSFFFSEFADYRRIVLDSAASQTKAQTAAEQEQSRLRRRRGSVHPLQTFTSQKPTFGGPLRRNALKYSGYPPKLDWIEKKLNQRYTPTGKFEQEYTSNIAAHHDTFESVDKIDVIFHIILKHYKPLVDAANAAALQASEWLHEANKFRLTALLFPNYRKKRFRRQKEFAIATEETLNTIQNIYADIRKDTEWLAKELCQRNDLTGKQKLYAESQDIFYGFLAEDLLRITRKFCRWCIYLDAHRPYPEIIYPIHRDTALKRSKVEKHFQEGRDSSSEPTIARDVAKEYAPVHNAQRRDPDSTPPRNLLHLVGKLLLTMKRGILSPTSIYVTKKASCGLPVLVLFMDRNTLRFAMANRLVWCMILGTLTGSPVAGEAVYLFIIRASFTLIGGLVGMASWYISTGSGHGNPYGMGATMAFSCLLMAYLRHFPPQSGGIVASFLFNLTLTLVTCVSYIDYYNPPVGVNHHQGFTIFWQRCTAVWAGQAVGFIFALLPPTATMKRAFRKEISELLKSTGDIQASLINFGLQRYDDEHIHQSLVKDAIKAKITSVSRVLSSLKVDITVLRFEPPLTGIWPSHHYTLLLKLLEETSYLQSIFYTVIDILDGSEDVLESLNLMGMLDSSILSSLYSVIYMTSTSIVIGDPLPTITPGHLIRDYLMLLKDIEIAHNIKPMELLQHMSKSKRGRALIVSSHCAELFFRRMDGILAIVKGLVGESFDFDPRLNRMFDHRLMDHMSL